MKKFIEKSFLLSILTCYAISNTEDLVSDTCRRPNSSVYDYELEDCRKWTSSFADGKIFSRYFRIRSIFFNPFREFVFDLIQKGRLPQGCIWFWFTNTNQTLPFFSDVWRYFSCPDGKTKCNVSVVWEDSSQICSGKSDYFAFSP